LPVYAEARGKSRNGHPVRLIITQTRGGQAYYGEAWRTDTATLLGARRTGDRKDVDYTLDELRAAGFDVKQY